MIEKDTIRLLRECDAGVKMGISSIEDVMDKVKNEELRTLLLNCKRAHEDLNEELQKKLNSYGDEGKEPGMMAKGMSRMKTEMKMMMEESDQTVADLMTDGCDMGVKSLSRYLNQYKAAEEDAKNMAKRLISLEEKLAVDIRKFL